MSSPTYDDWLTPTVRAPLIWILLWTYVRYILYSLVAFLIVSCPIDSVRFCVLARDCSWDKSPTDWVKQTIMGNQDGEFCFLIWANIYFGHHSVLFVFELHPTKVSHFLIILNTLYRRKKVNFNSLFDMCIISVCILCLQLCTLVFWKMVSSDCGVCVVECVTDRWWTQRIMEHSQLNVRLVHFVMASIY